MGGWSHRAFSPVGVDKPIFAMPLAPKAPRARVRDDASITPTTSPGEFKN
jgi:hypothetical protein